MFESKYNKLLTIVLVIVIIAIIGLLVFWGIEVFQKNSITNETAEFVDSYQGDDQTPDDETQNSDNDGSNPLDEIEESNTDIEINCENFLSVKNLPSVDLIVTSPPYVTSYEYADLHQLSSLWLGYADDYRDLRKGSIGSVYNSDDFTIDFSKLNETGKNIVKALENSDKALSKVKSVARYFVDMQDAVRKCAQMLNKNGMFFFVVGDTEYKGVKIQNSKHLVEAMEGNGYTDIKIAKRTISKGICVPYRDEKGKFSTDKSKRKVYHEEFIISGRM